MATIVRGLKFSSLFKSTSSGKLSNHYGVSRPLIRRGFSSTQRRFIIKNPNFDLAVSSTENFAFDQSERIQANKANIYGNRINVQVYTSPEKLDLEAFNKVSQGIFKRHPKSTYSAVPLFLGGGVYKPNEGTFPIDIKERESKDQWKEEVSLRVNSKELGPSMKMTVLFDEKGYDLIVSNSAISTDHAGALGIGREIFSQYDHFKELPTAPRVRDLIHAYGRGSGFFASIGSLRSLLSTLSTINIVPSFLSLKKSQSKIPQTDRTSGFLVIRIPLENSKKITSTYLSNNASLFSMFSSAFSYLSSQLEGGASHVGVLKVNNLRLLSDPPLQPHLLQTFENEVPYVIDVKDKTYPEMYKSLQEQVDADMQSNRYLDIHNGLHQLEQQVAKNMAFRIADRGYANVGVRLEDIQLFETCRADYICVDIYNFEGMHHLTVNYATELYPEKFISALSEAAIDLVLHQEVDPKLLQNLKEQHASIKDLFQTVEETVASGKTDEL